LPTANDRTDFVTVNAVGGPPQQQSLTISTSNVSILVG
jgi:hypothetical protein